jgi:hypothetical protein
MSRAVPGRQVAGAEGLLAGEFGLVGGHRPRGHVVVPDHTLAIVVHVGFDTTVSGTAVAIVIVAIVAGLARVFHTIATAGQRGVDAAGIRVAAVGRADIVVVAVFVGAPHARSAGTGVRSRTGVAVVAGHRVVGVDAPDISVTAIVGTWIAVVAIGRRTPDTGPVGAQVKGSARVVIVTLHRVVDKLTPDSLQAAIVGAGILIITGETGPTDADPAVTLVVDGADLAIIAGGRIQGIGTAGLGVTGIGGAWIAVIAIRWGTTQARTGLTGVARGTGIAIVAADGVGRVDTPDLRVAGIVGTGVAIITIQGVRRSTDSLGTLVTRSADVVVEALLFVVEMGTPGLWLARVVGAGIAVIAVELAGSRTLATTAQVLWSTRIAVIAGQLIEGRLTTAVGGTGIGGANVVVVAIQRGTGDTFALGAEVIHGTGIAVITVGQVGRVDAQAVHTGVIRADIVIVAIGGSTTDALTLLAEVIDGTRVAVVTGDIGCLMLAAPLGQADVLGTWITVIALETALAQTGARDADISRSTAVEVVAWGRVEFVATSSRLVAAIIRAGIAVVAVNQAHAGASAITALVSGGAGVAIVTGLRIGCVHAPQGRVTAVRGTDIAIVTIGPAAPLAQTGGTQVGNGASIPVITDGGIGHADTPLGRVTGFVGADIAVVAGQSCRTHALTVITNVTGRAGITIVTRKGIELGKAARLRVTQVGGTRVAIIAVGFGARHALTGITEVRQGAGVPVLARHPRIGCNFLTRPTHRIAHGCQTGTFRPLAGHHGVRIDGTLIGHLTLVANKRTIAQIAILQGSTVGVFLAVTGDLIATTLAGEACILHGAGIAIIAVHLVIGVDAAACGITGIVGTRVVIVTIDCRAHADTGLAVVCQGADIAIVAGGTVQGLVDASHLGVANTGCTLVAIIAFQVVHLAIAIVVQPITDLRGGAERVTLTQAFRHADPFPLTGACIIAHLTGCPEGQLHGPVGARADSGIRHTLFGSNAIHGRRLLAREPPRAIVVTGAQPPAKGPLLTVVHTDILGSSDALAVVP